MLRSLFSTYPVMTVFDFLFINRTSVRHLSCCVQLRERVKNLDG